ncbi:MAG: hypothetical protein JXB45_10365 [Candidatus Krumholzibacteriota bacterium]|nr:hypothetical protein [Candidatus Krumholzibacteriota bacterium]
MVIIRIFLVFALVYYLLKLIFKWLFSRQKEPIRGAKKNEKETDLRHLTDQSVEDAEYEDL